MPTKSLVVRRPYSTLNFSSFGSSPPTLSSISAGEFVWQDQFTGDSNPSWRSQVAQGSNATTLASGNRTTLQMGFCSSSSKVRRVFDGQVTNWATFGNPLAHLLESCPPPGNRSAIDQDVANKALIGFLRKCKGLQRQFSGGVFLGELREAIRLVRSPLLGFRTALDRWHDVCRGRVQRGNPSTLSRDLSNQWLEFQFGIKPLISDLGNGLDALSRLKNRRFRAFARFLSTSETLVSTNSVDLADFSIPLGIHVERQMKYVSTKRIIGEVHCEPDGPLARSEALGLGLRDFVPTVYELIPYSFLVDYFVNFGELIDAWSFNRADLAWHCETFRTECITEVKPTPFVLPLGPYEILSSHQALDPCSRREVSFVRSATPLGFPSVAFRLPGTSTKLLNIAALARLRTP